MPFRLAAVWWSIGVLLAAAVVVLSLVPPADGAALLPDKLLHFFAYLVLGFWFASLALDRRWLAVAAVVAMGGLVELLQGTTPYRYSEWLDFAANTAGVAVAYLFVQILPLNVFNWLEQHLVTNNR